MNTARSPHSATPTLVASDPRGLPLRIVGYCRRLAGEIAEARIERHAWNTAGQRLSSRDPRNLTYRQETHALSGQALLNDSMDAGWKLHLPGETGLPLFTWDARGSHWRLRCDELLRPVEIGETAADGSERIIERYEYAGTAGTFAPHNQAGRLLRHDDPGGTLHVSAYSLGGALERQTRHFLLSLDPVDWPQASAERDLLLERGDGFTTLERYNATGQLRSRSDACGNLTLFSHCRDGRDGPLAVQLAGANAPTPVLTRIEHDAWGRVASQTAGNGVITQSVRAPANGRLTRLCCRVPGQAALMDLHYKHDPLGNTLEILDHALLVRHFANQRIEPRCQFRHDSLYQLIEATGRELADARPGAGLPELQPLPADPSRQSNYRQHYQYDASGNLVQLRHVGNHSYTRTLQVAADSNRGLPLEDGRRRGDFAEAFDACGNPRHLLPGQMLEWNPRNQLARLTQVSRDNGADDEERYSYAADGSRLRKTGQRLTSGRLPVSETRYLPGLELRRDEATGERLQVILCNGVELLHWEQGLPAGIDNDQQRYQMRDHLGSHALELDGQATLLSQELHYPFGGSSWWAAASSSQARYKYRRYAGKERDASGLYHYGQRCYAPWLQRWLNPDPAGYADGANLYRMVGNRPLDFTDHQGTVKVPLDILMGDVLTPTAKLIGTGWFEELRWDNGQQAFASTGTVYGRGMRPFEGETSEWSLSDEGSAIALFRDNTDNLRLFTNTQHQHMGIQPGMGLPLFAGIIRRGPDGRALFDNHSGHYKPLATVGEVEAWLAELAPGAGSPGYQPIKESVGFNKVPRLDGISGPEEYADRIGTFRRDKTRLVDYLKDNGLWDIAREVYGEDPVLNVVFAMSDQGLTADEVYQQQAATDRAMQAAAAKPGPAGRAPSAPPPNRRKTAVVPRRSGGVLGLLRKCVGR